MSYESYLLSFESTIGLRGAHNLCRMFEIHCPFCFTCCVPESQFLITMQQISPGEADKLPFPRVLAKMALRFTTILLPGKSASESVLAELAVWELGLTPCLDRFGWSQLSRGKVWLLRFLILRVEFCAASRCRVPHDEVPSGPEGC